jgi:signal transduction histidine kinase
MGVFSSLGQERRRLRRPTIRFMFTAMVAGPVAGLLVLWGLLLTGVLRGALGDPDAPGRDHQVLTDFLIVVGAGLAIILTGVALMGWFARRLTRDITGLEATARHLADQEMPELIERLRRGEQVVPAEVPLHPHTKTAEIARAEAAVASLQHTAAAAAAAEAGLRNGIGQVFVSLARRNQSLLQRQLRLIDALEQKASDPATLADLFPLDHLTTRMRRHAEGLIILSGAAPGRSWSEPVPVIDVIRGAVAEVEDYKRVTVLTRAEDAVTGLAAADMIHLLAELIENATLSSPSGTRVEVRAERVANGFTVEIDDRGLGIEAGQLRTINQQLTEPPDFDLANADQLGLFVVGKLAARHGVRVALRPSPYGGTTAVVLMPNSIVVPMNETDADTQPDLCPAIGAAPGSDLNYSDALILTGRNSAPPSPSIGPPGQAGIDGSMPGLAAGYSVPGPRSPAPGPAGFAPAPEGFARPAGFAPGSPAPGPGPATDAGDSPLAGAQRGADTYRGLPRRIRQASLNPHLKNPTPSADLRAPAGGTPPSGARSPEEVRSFVASLQSGWQRGREMDAPDAGSADAAQTSQTPGSQAPQGEET